MENNIVNNEKESPNLETCKSIENDVVNQKILKHTKKKIKTQKNLKRTILKKKSFNITNILSARFFFFFLLIIIKIKNFIVFLRK